MFDRVLNTSLHFRLYVWRVIDARFKRFAKAVLLFFLYRWYLTIWQHFHKFWKANRRHHFVGFWNCLGDYIRLFLSEKIEDLGWRLLNEQTHTLLITRINESDCKIIRRSRKRFEGNRHVSIPINCMLLLMLLLNSVSWS